MCRTEVRNEELVSELLVPHGLEGALTERVKERQPLICRFFPCEPNKAFAPILAQQV